MSKCTPAVLQEEGSGGSPIQEALLERPKEEALPTALTGSSPSKPEGVSCLLREKLQTLKNSKFWKSAHHPVYQISLATPRYQKNVEQKPSFVEKNENSQV